MTDYSVEELNLNNKELSELPDLSLYTNLKKLNCGSNKLTSLDNLPNGLKELNCHYNQITQLDNVPIGLVKKLS